MQRAPTRHSAHGLGDFLTTPRLVPLSLIAICIGAIGAVVAMVLLRLIGLFTNLFFFQRWSTDLVSPAGNQLGLLEVAVPVVGALIIGAMARYGSERIRGHGIPEAIAAQRQPPRMMTVVPTSAQFQRN